VCTEHPENPKKLMVTVDAEQSTSDDRPARRRRWPRWLAGAVALLAALVLFVAYVWQPSAVEGYRSPYLSRVRSLRLTEFLSG